MASSAVIPAGMWAKMEKSNTSAQPMRIYTAADSQLGAVIQHIFTRIPAMAMPHSPPMKTSAWGSGW